MGAPALQLSAGCIVTIYFGSVIFGAPVTERIHITLCFSILQSLFLLPILIKERKQIVLIAEFSQSSRVYVFGLLACILCSSIVVPLDWNRWWQKWPIPQTLASCLWAGGYGLLGHKLKLMK